MYLTVLEEVFYHSIVFLGSFKLVLRDHVSDNRERKIDSWKQLKKWTDRSNIYCTLIAGIDFPEIYLESY